MNRTEFFELCNECRNDKKLIEQRLYEYFSNHKEALDKAPPCLLYDSDAKGKETTIDLAVKLLLQEVKVDGKKE